MGWISTLKNVFGTKPSSANSPRAEIGSIEPFCPYCGAGLDKMPGRKKKCPSCGEFIHVRTRPSDKQKILIREDQIEAIEEQWAILNGTHEQFIESREEYAKEKYALRNKFGGEPSENDVKWSILNKELLKYAQDFKWGLYRNTRLSMGDILNKESKKLEALDTYLEVCYLDVNGPNNCGSLDPKLLLKYPPFNPKMAFLAPAVISYINKIIDQQKLTEKQVEQRFIRIAEQTFESLDLPVNPEDAWNTLKKEIFDT